MSQFIQQITLKSGFGTWKVIAQRHHVQMKQLLPHYIILSTNQFFLPLTLRHTNTMVNVSLDVKTFTYMAWRSAGPFKFQVCAKRLLRASNPADSPNQQLNHTKWQRVKQIIVAGSTCPLTSV